MPCPISSRGNIACCSIHSNDCSNTPLLYGSNTKRSPGSPTTRIHCVMEPNRELPPVIMGVELGPKINVSLRFSKCPEILSDVPWVGISRDHRCHHKRRIYDLSKAKL